MKYSKIVKNNFENRYSYLISCTFSILLLFSICYFYVDNNIKGTNAAFGNVTGTITIPYTITYSSNWPDSSIENEIQEYKAKNQYTVLDNFFSVPSGYAFAGWNTKSDGTGILYVASDVIPLDANVELFAQWILVSDEDFEDDTSDENPDYSEDNNISSDNDSNNSDNNENDSSSSENINGSGNGSGSGSGSTSGGSNGSNSSSNNGSSSGTSSGSSNSVNNSGQNPSDNKDNNDNVDSPLDGSVENDSENSQKVFYEFKFMNGDKEYANTTCEVLSDGTCLLLIPGVNPTRIGYTFTGWNLNMDCSVTSTITNSIFVNSSNTYYACFMENAKNNTGINVVTVGVTVFAIWVVALSVIYYLVSYFKKKQNAD